jgi:hypothetical protein
MSVKRFVNGLRLDAARIDSNGFLKTDAIATRVGVFVYRRADGSEFRELRMPDEVFHPDSMSTLEMIPVTNDHPSESLVTPKNAKRFQVGMTGKVTKDDKFLKTEVVITDEKTITDIQNGKQQLSCGYTCELEHTSGVFNGERYDAIQRNIRYNHLAIVTRGRAGPSVRLHLDADDAVEVTDEQKEEEQKKDMKKVKIGDEFVELPEEIAEKLDAYLSKVKADMSKLTEDMEKMKAEKKADEADKLQAKLDAANEEISALKQKLDSMGDLSAKIAEGVKARLALERVAAKVLPAETKTDEMDDRALKIACIKACRPDFSEEGKSDVYLDAAFELLTEKKEEKKPETVPAHKKLDASGKAETHQTETAEQVRARRMKEDSLAWTQPLNKK